MSRYLKKSLQFFTRSNKEKKNDDVVKDCTPQINDPSSSSLQEEQCDDVNVEVGDDIYEEHEEECKSLENAKKLFVGGFADSTTPKKLEDYFSRFGQVVYSTVVRSPKSEKSRRFGFVTFVDPESAKAALEIKNHILDGKKINLEPFKFTPNKWNYENRIFLRGLPFSYTEEDVRQFFRKFGEVENVKIPLEKNTMNSKGFGFLSFKDKSVAEKFIAEGFVHMNNRRVFIRKAEPRSVYKINDNLNIDSTSDMNVNEGLEDLESFENEKLRHRHISDDDNSSVISGERRSVIELNSEIQKFIEDYFLTKFSYFKTMNEKETKDEFTDDDAEEIEKLLTDFFVNSNQQFSAFGEDLIEFSDKSEFSSSDAEEDTTDVEKDDTGNSVAKNFETALQELNAQFTKILEDKSKSYQNQEISELKSSAPQTSELFACKKSSTPTPFKIKDEKGSLVCSVCQWISPEGSCEHFLTHCKTPAHRLKLKERFLLDQNQKEAQETIFLQSSKSVDKICSKPKEFPEKHLTCSQEFLKTSKNQKLDYKKPKQSQSQQQPQAINVVTENKTSKKVRKRNKKDEKNTQWNLKLKAEKIKSLKITALAKSMACIQPLSEHEIICKMCSKIIPKAVDTNTLMKNVSHHLQSKGHLKKVLEFENSLRKSSKENGKKKKNDDAKKGNSVEKSAEEKKVFANDPKVKISKQNPCKNAALLLNKQKTYNEKKISESKNSAAKTAKRNPEEEKTDKKKFCSNTTDLKSDYLCLSCNSYFQNNQVFKVHINLNCLSNKNKKSLPASNNLHKCNGCKTLLAGSLYDINKHYAECLKRKN